ncbi:glycoside hydrolase family 28 protein [Flavobacterium sp. Sd200]|uniref:glycoside hydrolase family 28 protein n=1 Tax=Flavobacterium sp. Sd200 TaxID=2692211 RepID=UPI00136AAE7F|nr:glycoside hydrolase family 28 protein [Flavobacterium sp. Sd200]MXN92333.1 glycoside hydrolase family 28 protein [Flavobacterium sp. Sd200]
MKYLLLKSGLALLLCFLTTNSIAQKTDAFNESNIYEGIEFSMPKVKTTNFLDYEVSISDFGAVKGGVIKNTDAFTKAINFVASKGGGKVIVPRGIWLTGPITLKSNINLHLEEGSLIVFSKDFDDYKIIKTSYEGLNAYRCISPINANGVENVGITGNGIIDGGGDAWRPINRNQITSAHWEKLVSQGGVLSEDGKTWLPSEKAKKGFEKKINYTTTTTINDSELNSIKDFLRPVMVSIVNSKRVLLDGPTFQNSPAWNLHPLMCEDVIIRNCKIRNTYYSQNGDGLDLESCNNALVYNNTFDVGDDAICIKSGKDKDGRDRGIPTKNVIVKNNVVYRGHGGFVIGSEMSGGINNVHVSNCTFIGTDIGLRFKSTRGRGGIVENIYISNIDMIQIAADAISFNMYYFSKRPAFYDSGTYETNNQEEPLVAITEETPSFRNIFMKNIMVCESGIAAFFMGLPEMNLKNVSLENSVFQTKKGITTIDSEGLALSNVKIIASDDYALTLYNTKKVKTNDLMFNESKSAIRILGSKSVDIQFNKRDFPNANDILISKKVEKNSVKIK